LKNSHENPHFRQVHFSIAANTPYGVSGADALTVG
jgi:hypothetical protein